MKVVSERLKKKFDELDGKINFMMKHYSTLQLENKELISKINQMQADVGKKKTESAYSEKEAFIQARIDRFLTKLNALSNDFL
jgi:hypothetical protein